MQHLLLDLVIIVGFLLNTVGTLLGGALLLRTYVSWLRIASRNPLSQFSWALTEWLVKPFRNLLPRRTRVDWPCVVAALVVGLLYVLLMRLIGLWPASDWSLLVPQALGVVVRWGLYMVVFLVIIYAVLSVVNPHAPLAPTFDLLTRPLLAPFRRVLPVVGGFDLSPLALLLVVMILFALVPLPG